jgi:hypothetical protein
MAEEYKQFRQQVKSIDECVQEEQDHSMSNTNGVVQISDKVQERKRLTSRFKEQQNQKSSAEE